MAEYTHHPEPGFETRDGWGSDDYVAQARGFSSTAEFREYRAASEERRAEMRADRDSRDSGADENDDEDRVRYLEYLRSI